MKKSALLWLAAMVLVLAPDASAQVNARPNGAIVEEGPCAAFPATTYEQYALERERAITGETAAAARDGFKRDKPADFTPFLLTRDQFAARQAYKGFECRRVTYSSDGLKVAGLVWKPKDVQGRLLPLVIFCRGGNREFSKLMPRTKWGFYDYLAAGFVVIGSQYRGNDGGEGQEEFGGADVGDVVNLVPLAESLGYVDMGNVFILGASRGGMMTLLALKHGIRVNAAAVQGGIADLVPMRGQRASMGTVFEDLIPDFESRGDAALRERSAVYWAESINVPLLILHGGADWRVDPASNALALAQRLQEVGKTYELVVYAGDDHGLSRNAADGDARVIAWFKRHMK